MGSQALVQITTWNVGSIDPVDIRGFSPFKSPLNRDADIHVFGFQEANRFSEKDWVKALTQLSGNKYRYMKGGSINGLIGRALILLVFSLKALDTRFGYDKTSVATSRETAKGAVTINLKAGKHPNFMSFTGAHLSAGQDKIKDRIDDYNKIMEKTKFESGSTIKDHQFRFFFGDLNFRLANINASQAIQMIRQNTETKDKLSLQKLFLNDQLSQVRSLKKAFREFDENDPSGFAPTYKMIRGKFNEYESNRVPSWTDRILFAAKEIGSAYKIKQLYYGSLPELVQSDHKPVVGLFQVDLP